MNLLALYRGRNLADVELVAVTSRDDLVSQIVEQLLLEPEDCGDASLAALRSGRRTALQTIADDLESIYEVGNSSDEHI